MKIIFYAFIISFCLGCKNNTSKGDTSSGSFYIEKKKELTQKDSLTPKTDLVKILSDTIGKSKLDLKLLHISKLRRLKKHTSIVDSIGCSKWQMDESFIKEVIDLSVPISDAEKHHLYNIEHCALEGIIKYSNLEYLFEINGGGWIEIYNDRNKEYIILGCNKSECEKYFVSRGITQDE